jgi:hypothetical protein
LKFKKVIHRHALLIQSPAVVWFLALPLFKNNNNSPAGGCLIFCPAWWWCYTLLNRYGAYMASKYGHKYKKTDSVVVRIGFYSLSRWRLRARALVVKTV